MRYQGLVAIGHGMTPPSSQYPHGRYQPGAVKLDLEEHAIAARAVYWTQKALERCGVTDVYYEADGGEGHQRDPNYSGSVRKARELGVRWAVELHMNAGDDFNSGGGTETLYHPGHEPSKRLAFAVQNGTKTRIRWENRGVKAADGHSFTKNLASSGIAAVIVEGAFLDGDYSRIKQLGGEAFAWRYGEGVAAGVCAYLGKQWIPHRPATAPTPKPAPAPTRAATIVVNKPDGHFLTETDSPRVAGDVVTDELTAGRDVGRVYRRVAP